MVSVPMSSSGLAAAKGPRAPVSSLHFDAIPRIGPNWPADPSGAIGDAAIVTAVNTSIAVYDRAGVALLAPTPLAPLGTFPPGTDLYDPKVVYDPYAQEFVLVFLAIHDTLELSWIVLSAMPGSTASDPATWCVHQLRADQVKRDGKQWADYPGLGYDRDRVTVTSNQFDFAQPQGFAKSNWLLVRQDRSERLRAATGVPSLRRPGHEQPRRQPSLHRATGHERGDGAGGPIPDVLQASARRRIGLGAVAAPTDSGRPQVDSGGDPGRQGHRLPVRNAGGRPAQQLEHLVGSRRPATGERVLRSGPSARLRGPCHLQELEARCCDGWLPGGRDPLVRGRARHLAQNLGGHATWRRGNPRDRRGMAGRRHQWAGDPVRHLQPGQRGHRGIPLRLRCGDPGGVYHRRDRPACRGRSPDGGRPWSGAVGRFQRDQPRPPRPGRDGRGEPVREVGRRRSDRGLAGDRGPGR